MKHLTALGIAFVLSSVAGASSGTWYARPDGSLQCQPETRKPEFRVQAELKKAKIKVLEFKRITDGKFRIQVCGSPTGILDAVRADPSQEKALKKLGFRKQTVPLKAGS